MTMTIEEPSGNKITGQQWSHVVKNVRNKLQNVQVSNSYVNDKAGPTITFQTADERDKAEDALKSDYKLISQNQVPKKLAPRLKILGVSEDIFSESDPDIIEEIRHKNKTIDDQISEGENLKIIYKNKKDSLIVIQTTRKIREAIKMSNDKIFIGLQVLNVYDHVHPVQCFHCQEFKHIADSDYCKLKGKSGVCFYCAANHKSSDCKNKKNSSKHRCINCINDKRQHIHHKSTDPLCPTIIRETLRVYARTDGMDENSKNWYLQMIEKLKQKRSLA